MKKHSKLLVTLLILALAMCSFAACGGGEEEPAQDDVNQEQAAATALWNDEYVKLIQSGQEREYENYDAIMQVLRDFQTAEGAKYVYCVMPKDADDIEGDYILTVDASEKPDKWGENYGFEKQFEEASKGEVAAARSAWNDNDEGTEFCWSAFSPVKDADGNVVAIVGIDYPAPVVADYPEWNRKKDEWNKAEDEWPEDIPADIQKLIDDSKDRAEKLGKQLESQEIEITEAQ